MNETIKEMILLCDRLSDSLFLELEGNEHLTNDENKNVIHNLLKKLNDKYKEQRR
jgi:hypothetical protein